MRSDDTLCS